MRRILAAIAALGFSVGVAVLGQAPVFATQLNCVSDPGSCGYASAANTGVPSGTTLTNVPAQATSGTGWSWNSSTSQVNITTAGATFKDYNVSGAIEVKASNVTVEQDQALGIQIPSAETGVTVFQNTVKGLNSGSGRTQIAIDDATLNSTGIYIAYNDVSNMRIGIQAAHGTIYENYLHDFGFVAGDHSDGILTGGGTGYVQILANTIFNGLGQTDAITLNASTNGQTVSNALVEYNFIAGGDYAIYAGDRGFASTTSNIVIENNRFGQQYDSDSGTFGSSTNYDPSGSGNVWTGNFFDTDGSTVSANS